MTKPRAKADPRLDRLSESFRAATLRDDPPWETGDRGGARNPDRDGADRRRTHPRPKDLRK